MRNIRNVSIKSGRSLKNVNSWVLTFRYIMSANK